VRALTRVATAETEGHLIMIARHASAAQLERIVRGYRSVVGYELGADDGSLLLRARLPAEEGALVLAALDAGRDALREARAPRQGEGRESGADSGAGSASDETTHIGDTAGGDADRGEHAPAPGEGTTVSNADAMVLMAQTLLSSGAPERAPADRYQVVVHVDAATLAGDEEGACQLEDGTELHPETARRLGCDASLVRILERDGRPLSVGRRTRSVPPALRRALTCRDPICRFPGCPQRRYLHAHHVDHWARGGRTDLSNLVHLCSHHHRLVHEGGYRIDRGPDGALRFKRPDGRPVPAAPPRPPGDRHELQRTNTAHRLQLTDQTCRPRVYPDRLDLHWVVDNLAETDSRLTGTVP
jgi:hypothetical protein